MNRVRQSAKRPKTFLGRQPIRNRQFALIGYELLSRPSPVARQAEVSDDAIATADVVKLAFSHIGTPAILGRAAGFLNVDAESLLSGAIENLPKEHVVLELLETVVIDQPIIERCLELKAKGYRLALDDFCHYGAAYEPLLQIVDVVKIDILQLDDAALAGLVTRLKPSPVLLLAEKVESAASARLCLALGFDLFQGFFFGRPIVCKP